MAASIEDGRAVANQLIVQAHDALLTEVDAADLLRLSVRTLQAWRARGFGPAFVRAGRAIRYRRRDLKDWVNSSIVRSRTPG